MDSSAQSAEHGHAESADAFVGLLEQERSRLQNAVDHLQQSNMELKSAIAETGPDKDFKEAIEENIVVIAKYKARIERLDKELAELKRGLQVLHDGEALLASGSAGQPQQEGQQAQQPEQRQQETSEQPEGSGGDAVMEEAAAGQQQQQQQQDAEMEEAAEPLRAGGTAQQGEHLLPGGPPPQGGIWI
ncbi:hypothetical protein N2152v2_007550 [Parachlorella kessleri]